MNRSVGRATISLAAIVVLALAIVPARATVITLSVPGTVTFAQSGNPFGISVGDTITASATFDEALVPLIGTFVLGPAGLALSIPVGTMVTFTEADDTGALTPSLTFVDRALTRLALNASGVAFLPFFDELTFAIAILSGNFTLSDPIEGDDLILGNFSLPVPIPLAVSAPATLPLFATGLLGLALILRLRRSASRPAARSR